MRNNLPTAHASRYKPYIGITGMFFLLLFVAAQLGIRPLQFLSPLPAKIDVFDAVVPRLEQKENTFQLRQSRSFVSQASAAESYDLAKSYLLMDFATGEVLQSSHANVAIPIASLTKIMTAVVALDLVSPQESFTVTKDAADEIPTKIGVIPGEKMTVDELLHALLMTSANDAAAVIKDGVNTKYGGNVFIRAMNEKAAVIGLTRTHFMNPQGFDDQAHYSSAEDLAVLSHYALTNYPLIADIVTKEYLFLPATPEHKQFDLYNWNGLLGVYPGASGIKIGNTDAAGKTTVVMATREGKTLLAVLLGAPGILQRDMWTAQLLDTGFQQTSGLEPIKVTEDALREKYATWKLE